MKISQLKHRIALCSGYDEAVSTREVLLARFKVVEAWADIVPVRGQLFVNANAVQESRINHSHLITLRFSPELEISAYAWIFELRGQSGGRWYKVLSVREENDRARWWRCECRLVQKGDTALPTEPAPQAGAFAPVPLKRS